MKGAIPKNNMRIFHDVKLSSPLRAMQANPSARREFQRMMLLAQITKFITKVVVKGLRGEKPLGKTLQFHANSIICFSSILHA